MAKFSITLQGQDGSALSAETVHLYKGEQDPYNLNPADYVGQFTNNGDGTYQITVNESNIYSVIVQGKPEQTELIGIFISAEDIQTHITDQNNPHSIKADQVPITDSGGYFTGSTVEDALQELGADTDLQNHISDQNNPHNVKADQVEINDANGYFIGNKVEDALNETRAITGNGDFSATNYISGQDDLTKAVRELDRQLTGVQTDSGGGGGETSEEHVYVGKWDYGVGRFEILHGGFNDANGHGIFKVPFVYRGVKHTYLKIRMRIYPNLSNPGAGVAEVWANIYDLPDQQKLIESTHIDLNELPNNSWTEYTLSVPLSALNPSQVNQTVAVEIMGQLQYYQDDQFDIELYCIELQ